MVRGFCKARQHLGELISAVPLASSRGKHSEPSRQFYSWLHNCMKPHITVSRNLIQAEALETIIFHVVIIRLQKETISGLCQDDKPPGSAFQSFSRQS